MAATTRGPRQDQTTIQSHPMTTALAPCTQVDKQSVSLAETPADPIAALTVQQVLLHVSLIQQIMAAAMKEGEHFGRIPGCGDKPTLLKPGAEKLCLTFRLAPTYEVEERLLERGHREYRVTTTLTSIMTQANIGQGVGTCTTLENKFRFRAGAAEPTDRTVPRAYWDIRQEDPAKAQELIGGKGFSVKKVDGQGWMIAKGGEKVEHDNPADYYNTVLKMAKKRALVDAVLTSTAASDIFTQDLEDISASLATLSPANPTTAPASATPTPARATVIDVSADPAPSTPAGPAAASAVAPVASSPAASQDFRLMPVHFGKNRGMTLADLTPQQLHWYEMEWMPKKEAQPTRNEGDEALKAYRVWREAEKETERQAQAKAEPAPAKVPAPRQQRRRATAQAEAPQAT